MFGFDHSIQIRSPGTERLIQEQNVISREAFSEQVTFNILTRTCNLLHPAPLSFVRKRANSQVYTEMKGGKGEVEASPGALWVSSIPISYSPNTWL